MSFGFGDVLFFAIFGSILYVFYRWITGMPILPWKESDVTTKKSFNNKKKNKSKSDVEEDEEPDLFRDLLEDVEDITDHMLRLKGNRFVLFAEIEPVNYFLLSQEEQEAIDAAFETWIAQIDYQVQWYLQNRYVDLSEPIEEMKKNMFESEDLPENAFNYGRSMIDDLERWQAMTPRFETKRYILFPLKVREEDIQADDEEEFEERVLEKAFQELYRRFNTAKSGLHKSKMEVHLLTNEGILEVLYHAFNRRKAIRNKFKNLKLYENLALYPTADQDLPHIEMVKGMIESDVVEENKKAV